MAFERLLIDSSDKYSVNFEQLLSLDENAQDCGNFRKISVKNLMRTVKEDQQLQSHLESTPGFEFTLPYCMRKTTRNRLLNLISVFQEYKQSLQQTVQARTLRQETSSQQAFLDNIFETLEKSKKSMELALCSELRQFSSSQTTEEVMSEALPKPIRRKLFHPSSDESASNRMDFEPSAQQCMND